MPKDCLELLHSGTSRSGVYSIDPDGMGPLQVSIDNCLPPKQVVS